MSGSEVLNPVAIEQQISAVTDEIAKGVRIVTDAEYNAARLRREYDRAYALAYGRAEGSIQDKKYSAELATLTEREAAENAEITFRHAQRTAKALEKKLDALRSQGASVRAMYEAVRP
ncbi:hypothetical protein ACFY4C_20350 [Actinomadura viridis]|uniref:hypothetical protein n=1 Tax=Actinomadura viridis TaxID=58110 RepID=UPI00369158AA